MTGQRGAGVFTLSLNITLKNSATHPQPMKPPYHQIEPGYSNSRALIIGINSYLKAPPLGYAVSDACAVAEILIKCFDFDPNLVTLLTDEEATRERIMRELLQYTHSVSNANERLLFFFAGHGHTVQGRRGDVGYLVPHCGAVDDLSSLIRWDDLTRNADLIPSKHILFIMDACYSGLALTRSTQSNQNRFINDMMTRISRQVITAGKANETVADSGGPIPNHSVFTGHLINALEGGAESEDKIISATSVMSYVYEHVSRDVHSNQTPHFGHFDGDGDFIFKAPILKSGFLIEHPLREVWQKRSNEYAPLITALISLLKSPDATTRISAIKQIEGLLFDWGRSESEYRSAKELIGGAIIDDDKPVRLEALYVLAEHATDEDTSMVPYLIENLDDTDPEIRWVSASCLAKIGKKASPAIPRLMEALKDDNEWVCEDVAGALQAIGDEAANVICRPGNEQYAILFRQYIDD